MATREFTALQIDNLDKDVAKAVICIEAYKGLPETQYNAFLLKSGKMEVWRETLTGTMQVKGQPVNKECRKYFRTN